MAERPNCARTDQLIPELAIGVAAGDERASALGHLARCVPCRNDLESATAAADALLLVAPDREPPPGFEGRVLAGIAGHAWRDTSTFGPAGAAGAAGIAGIAGTAPARPRRRPRRRPRTPPHPAGPSRVTGPGPHTGPATRAGPRPARWRRTLLRAATTVAIAALVGGALWWRTDDERQLADAYRTTLAIAHGRYMRAAPLMTQGAVPAGHLLAYEGQPSWIFVVVRTGDVTGDYTVRLVTRDGRPMRLGTMSVAHGQGSWGATISMGVDRIAAVTLSAPRARSITARLA